MRDLSDTLPDLVPPDAGAPDAAWREWLEALPAVDEADAQRRAAELAGRRWPDRRAALEKAIACTDLTTLEATDTPERVEALCARAVRPDPEDPACPPVAAVCTWPDLAAVAVAALKGAPVRVAAVAGAFPSGRAPLRVRVAEVEAAVAAGASEVDIVIDRAALRAGRYGLAAEQLGALVVAAGQAHVKVILELAELPDLTTVRRAAWLALLCGAAMVKTSTGKAATGATSAGVLVLLEAARDFAALTGRGAGVKAAGGIRTADEALGYLGLAAGVGGEAWLDPARFRFGASSLLDDLVAERGKGS